MTALFVAFWAGFAWMMGLMAVMMFIDDERPTAVFLLLMSTFLCGTAVWSALR